MGIVHVSMDESYGGGPVALAVGNFDGVHVGHRALLGETVRRAREARVSPCCLTFDPHPTKVLGKPTPALLTTIEDRATLTHALGIEKTLLCRFDDALSRFSAQDFVHTFLVNKLHARIVVVGENFRFGAERKGDFELLKRLGRQWDFQAIALPLLEDSGNPISSTRIRKLISEGAVRDVVPLLGRFHGVSGEVETGRALGRTLGFPTANLGRVAELIPADGVYAARTLSRRGDEWMELAKAVVNIGLRPTVEGAIGRTVEAHLLDFTGELVGARLRLEFVARLRGEQRFASLEALSMQIACDIEEARKLF